MRPHVMSHMSLLEFKHNQAQRITVVAIFVILIICTVLQFTTVTMQNYGYQTRFFCIIRTR